jgi:hypothetical protein
MTAVSGGQKGTGALSGPMSSVWHPHSVTPDINVTTKLPNLNIGVLVLASSPPCTCVVAGAVHGDRATEWIETGGSAPPRLHDKADVAQRGDAGERAAAYEWRRGTATGA